MLEFTANAKLPILAYMWLVFSCTVTDKECSDKPVQPTEAPHPGIQTLACTTHRRTHVSMSARHVLTSQANESDDALHMQLRSLTAVAYRHEVWLDCQYTYAGLACMRSCKCYVQEHLRVEHQCTSFGLALLS